MAAKSSDWRPGPTVCRCCLSEGCYKDISTEYFWMGKREVYSEMLADTFDVSISYSKSGGPNSQSRLICEPCIARLRDAADFKRQVQECEKTFVNCLDPATALNDLQASLELEKEVKVEMVMKEEKRHSDDDDFGDAPDFGDDDDYDDLDDQPLTKLASKIPKKETVDVLDLLDNAKIPEKRKSSSKHKSQPSKKVKTKQIASSSKEKPEPKKKKDPGSQETQGDEKSKEMMILRKHLIDDVTEELQDTQEIRAQRDKTEKDWAKIAERRGLGPILRENTLKLIQHSTMIAFQYNKSWFTCYCCKQTFPGINLLRDHTESEHTLQDIRTKIIVQRNKYLKVEISFLKCKLCKREVFSVIELRQHLQDAHDVKFEDGKDLLVPYKIQTEGMKCQICYEDFTNFRLLTIHTNRHYQNHICDVCGTSFPNLVFLSLHKTRSHRKIRCEKCDLNFDNRSDKKHHDVNEHNMTFVRKRRFPCPYCDERFFQENFKIQHLVEKHGMVKPEHRCSWCAKVFITRALLNNHTKNVHKKERKHECDVCHNVFYTKSDLARHRTTHTGEKKFSCALCNCPFASKDSLLRHLKRNACRS